VATNIIKFERINAMTVIPDNMLQSFYVNLPQLKLTSDNIINISFKESCVLYDIMNSETKISLMCLTILGDRSAILRSPNQNGEWFALFFSPPGRDL
jgi:hypothetical protein